MEKMNRLITGLGVALLLALAPHLKAVDYYVATNGDDENGGTTPEAAFATLDKAVGEAADGDVIYITNGIYQVTSPPLLIEKAITLEGYGEATNSVVVTPDAPSSPTILILSNAAARVANMSFTGVSLDLDLDPTEESRAGVVVVHLGTFDNCEVMHNTTHDAGGVRQFGGLVVNCRLYNNIGNCNKAHWIGWGGGLAIAGGIASNCVVYGNYVRCGGGGVHITGGLVVDCVVTNNTIERHLGTGVFINGGTLLSSRVSANNHTTFGYVPYGALAIMRGLADRCVISDHNHNVIGSGVALVSTFQSVTPNAGAPAPALRNSLVYGNISPNNGAGVHLAGGTIESCTITRNRSTTGVGSGVAQSGGAISNSIIYANGITMDELEADNLASSGGTIDYSLVAPLPAGEGNIVAWPLFVDPAALDFRLRPGSPAIDAGSELAVVTNDFSGLVRPQGSAHDIGAHEYQPATGALTCGFTLTPNKLHEAGDVTLQGYADGDDLEGLSFHWDFNNDGTIDATGDSAIWHIDMAGAYDVLLIVSNTAGEAASYLRQQAILYTLPIAYVSPDGSAIPPYLTWETAANDLQDAINAVEASEEAPGTVYVAAGSYDVADLWITVTRPVSIYGVDGAEVTTLKAWNGGVDMPRRVMLVNHPQAVVSGFSMINGKLNTDMSDGAGPGGLRLVSGVVSNCIIRDNWGSDNAGGVEVRGGTLANCLIRNNQSHRSNNASVGKGGGITISDGVVTNCIVTSNKVYLEGAGVYATGGTVCDTVISNNYTVGNSRYGAGLSLNGAAIVERCLIRDNTSPFAAGVYLQHAAAILRNSLVVNNEALDEGGGLYLKNGLVDFCTIVGNFSGNLKGGGLYQSGGTVQNSIIYGNGGNLVTDLVANINKTGGTFQYSLTLPAVAGSGNLAVNPLFTAPESGDYTLAVGSAAIDSANDTAGVSDDLNGALRPQDGAGAGVAAPDMGCYEADAAAAGALRCAYNVSPVSGMSEVEATFTAHVAGEGFDGEITYSWDFNNDGVADLAGVGPAYATTSQLFDSYGYHTVTLTVYADGKSASFTIPNTIAVGSATAYVSEEGDSIWPYATWQTAATNILDAINSLILAEGVRSEVIVADGTYPINDFWAIITAPLTIRSVNGPEKTTLKAANPGQANWRRIMYVNHPDALISGFTMRDGSVLNNTADNAGPGALRLLAGTVSNCVIRSNIGADNSGGVELGGGLLTHSIIDNNQAYRGNNSSVGMGGGVWVYGGLLSHCIVTNNLANGNPTTAAGGGVRLTGGKIERCYIANNMGGDKTHTGKHGGGLYQTAGEAAYCTIANNAARGDGAGAYVTGGRLHNSLIVGNTSQTSGTGHGLVLNGAAAQLENLTIVDNAYESAGSGVDIRSGFVTNCIAWYNATVDLQQSGGQIGYSCWSEAPATDHNISAEPLFADRDNGNYRLAAYSPCIDAGTKHIWSPEDIDLDGNPRLRFRSCDIGAYERNAGNETILILR